MHVIIPAGQHNFVSSHRNVPEVCSKDLELSSSLIKSHSLNRAMATADFCANCSKFTICQLLALDRIASNIMVVGH